MSVHPAYHNMDSSDEVSFDQTEFETLLQDFTHAHHVGQQYPFAQAHSTGGVADSGDPSPSGVATERQRSPAPHHPGNADGVHVPVDGEGLSEEDAVPRQAQNQQPNLGSSQVTSRTHPEADAIDQDSLPRTSKDIPSDSQSRRAPDVKPRSFPERMCWNCCSNGYHISLQEYQNMCEAAKHMSDVLQDEIHHLECDKSDLEDKLEKVLKDRDTLVNDLKDEIEGLSSEAERRQGVFDAKQGEHAREARALTEQVDKLKGQVNWYESNQSRMTHDHDE